MKALIFANGDVNDGEMVRRALDAAHAALILAADGGAHVAGYFGLLPSVVIGDMDSLSEVEIAALQKRGAQVMRHPAEKAETDLELALRYAAGQGASWIRVVGGVGDRFDQTMGNVLLLALPELVDTDVRLVAGKQAIWLMRPGTHQIEGAAGDTLSLLPLGGDASGIRTDRLYYPLRDETLHFGPARGISNVMIESQAGVTFATGMLLAVHTVGRA